jgi:type I restriction enzyme, S subunit
MLPEGWSQLRLGDIFKFKNGLNGDSSLYGSGAKFVNVMDAK